MLLHCVHSGLALVPPCSRYRQGRQATHAGMPQPQPCRAAFRRPCSIPLPPPPLGVDTNSRVSTKRHQWLFATPSHTQSASSHKPHRASHSKNQMKTATTDERWAGLLPQSALHPIHPIPSCKSPHPGQHPHQVKMTPRERASA
jgi:hypothetical protein